jgi:hypothetical protein
MSRRDVGVARKGELAQAPALPPLTQMPTDRSAYGPHGAKLIYVAESSNYLRGKLFLTSDVIEFLSAAGDISGAGTAAVPQ